MSALLAGDPSRTVAMVDEPVVAGSPEQVVGRPDALLDAGVDRIGIWPFPSESFAGQLTTLADDVLPHLCRR
ncbi:hypothetical protein [Jiangella sp. DSM 45060]|uniref:hypothetical protein n=1 Tax=Jiangella sp. DSM 45060 TaxID=1798224 RepID=UPI001E2E8AE7|nr:hypothetical protein [Jiangella sp. DSM 45060]